MTVCDFEGCERRRYAKGLCHAHYQQKHRYGGQLRKIGTRQEGIGPTPKERFEKHVDRSGNCHIWTGGKVGSEYGCFHINGKQELAHRVAYISAWGEIPEGLVIDHRCWTPACVNPDHLRAVTQKQNMENRSGAQRNSASGVRGVYLKAGAWAATLKSAGKTINAGSYSTIAEADGAARKARLITFTHNDRDRTP